MRTHDELRQDIEEQRARLPRLSEASVRVSESLDVDTVLREAVESARALTGARYGAIVTIDESGKPRDFVFSGVTPDEHRSLMAWPDAPRLFEHLRDVPGPLRVPDLAAFAKSLGFSWDVVPLTTFQVTPMLHRGVRVGNFCLGQKEGGRPFTDADEEVLVLFASQAATAIANARTYRDEQRARTDLDHRLGRDRAEDSLARSPGGSLQRETGQGCVLPGDDDPQMLKYVRDALEGPGYSTVSTVDPQEVPQLLKAHRPLPVAGGPARRNEMVIKPPRTNGDPLDGGASASAF